MDEEPTTTTVVEMATVVVATAFGGPEVLSLVQRPVGAPAADEVTIEVRASAVNPLDHLLYSGAFGSDADRLPMPVGQELAGVVIATGAHAVGPAGPIQVGDEVIACPRDRSGAAASAITWPARAVVPKPPSMSWEQAAGLLFAGSTAVHALTATDVGHGDTVLIHGVSGAVGMLAAQLAVHRGARVIGTAAPARHQALTGYGIEPVEYGPGLAERVRRLTPAGVDAAVDTAGTDEAIDTSLALVPDRARIATLVAFARGNDSGVKTLTVDVTRTFPLAEVAAAHQLVATGHAGGKVTLRP